MMSNLFPEQLPARPGQHLNAWCEYPYLKQEPLAQGPLAGMTLAVKDIYPVFGYPNGWGQPTRLEEALPDKRTHTEIQKLLDAGAHCLGKSQCEELCYSLMGSNKHYGAPINPKAPDRLVGGSSSGSASLVAGAAVDIATASDTAGSVRAPASFCGLIGLRPTHGVLSLDGAMPLAPSFDCFGWYAKDIDTYALVADVLLERCDVRSFTRLLVADQVMGPLAGDAEKLAFQKGSCSIQDHFDDIKAIEPFTFGLEEASSIFTTHQAFEAWQSLGPWVTTRLPNLDASIMKRLQLGSSISQDNFEWAADRRRAITDEIESLIGTDGLLLLPTVPSCAPLRSSDSGSLQEFRNRMLQLLCLSGLSGLPQITLPISEVHGAPFGISVMGPRGSDLALVALASNILASRRERSR